MKIDFEKLSEVVKVSDFDIIQLVRWNPDLEGEDLEDYRAYLAGCTRLYNLTCRIAKTKEGKI